MKTVEFEWMIFWEIFNWFDKDKETSFSNENKIILELIRIFWLMFKWVWSDDVMEEIIFIISFVISLD